MLYLIHQTNTNAYKIGYAKNIKNRMTVYQTSIAYFTLLGIKEGSLEEFLDALDFAPEGVKDLIKKYSLELPLNDVAKREALLKKEKFNVTAMLENSKEDIEEAAAPTGRRVKKAEVEEEETAVEAPKPKRRAKAPVAE